MDEQSTFLQAETHSPPEAHFSVSSQSLSERQTSTDVVPSPPPKPPFSFDAVYAGAEITVAFLPIFTVFAIINVSFEKMPEVSVA